MNWVIWVILVLVVVAVVVGGFLYIQARRRRSGVIVANDRKSRK